MKKQVLTGVLFVIISSNAFAQKNSMNSITTDETANSRFFYKLKSTRQQTIGWVLLGAGVGLSGIAASSWTLENMSGPTTMFVIGSAAAVSSIPLFIAASKNNKKAALIVGRNTIPGVKQDIKYSTVGLSFPISK